MERKECIIHLDGIFSFELLMGYNTSEISKYIQIAKEKHKEGNLHQANEIYKKLINQKIYTYDLLISYGLFNKDINNLEIAKNLLLLSIKKYPLNDGVTITPGIYIIEGTTDVTGVALKTSFSF